MTDIDITRSGTNPDLYLVTVINSDGDAYVFAVGWQQLEKLNRQIVELRTQDDLGDDRAEHRLFREGRNASENPR